MSDDTLTVSRADAELNERVDSLRSVLLFIAVLQVVVVGLMVAVIASG